MAGLICAFVFLFLPEVYASGIDAKIVMKLHMSKPSYLAGEMIYVYLNVENPTDQEISTSYPNGRSVEFAIVDEKGDHVGEWITIDHLGRDPSLELAPRQKMEFILNWASYGNGPHDFKPGKYEAWALLDSVKSDSVEFEITEPIGEEAIVRIKIQDLPMRTGVDVQAALDGCEELLRSYPNTVYSPNLYRMTMYYGYVLGKHEVVMAAALEFIERYSSFPVIEHAVNYFQKSFFAKLGVDGDRHATPDEIKRASLALDKLRSGRLSSRELDYFVNYYSNKQPHSRSKLH